jgi:hypothetical protein
MLSFVGLLSVRSTRLPALVLMVAAAVLSVTSHSESTRADSGDRPKLFVRPRTIQQRTFVEEDSFPGTNPALAPPSVPPRSAPVEPVPANAPGAAPLTQAAPTLQPLVIEPGPFPGPQGQAIPEYPALPTVSTPQFPGPAGLGPGEPVPGGFVPGGPAPGAIASAADCGYWIVSSRNCPVRADLCGDLSCLRTLYRDPSGCLHCGSLPQFYGSLDPTRPVVFVIHGSYNYWRDVLIESERMKAWLSRSGTSRPIQMVYFTWPSDGYVPVLLPLEIAILGRRSAAHSVYLAGLIQQLPPGPGVSMIGHSHGARTALAAAHVLGGGVLENGQGLASGGGSQRPLRAVLLAAAVDHQWLNPGDRYGQALPCLERVLLFRNCQDFWLTVYPLRKPFGEPALSRDGLSPWDRSALGPLASKIVEIDVTRDLRRGHNLATYYRREYLASVAGRFAAFEDNAPPISLPGQPLVIDPQVIDPQQPGSLGVPANAVPGYSSPGFPGGVSQPVPGSYQPWPGPVVPGAAIPTPAPGYSTNRTAPTPSPAGPSLDVPSTREPSSPATILPPFEDEPVAPRRLPTGQRAPLFSAPRR